MKDKAIRVIKFTYEDKEEELGIMFDRVVETGDKFSWMLDLDLTDKKFRRWFKEKNIKPTVEYEEWIPDINAWFDGSILSNPDGAIGWGAVVLINGIFAYQTWSGEPAAEGNSNNTAEYKGLRATLDYLERILSKGQKVTIHTDSKLVANQISGTYKIKKGRHRELALECRKRIAKIASEGVSIEVVWLKREQNEVADALSKRYKGHLERILQIERLEPIARTLREKK